MRIGIAYGVLAAGGCERRMGELARTLLDQGDDVHILASHMKDDGGLLLTGTCDVPYQNIHVCPPEGDFKEWLLATVNGLELGVLDMQWHIRETQYLPDPADYNCPMVITLHNPLVALPPKDWGHKALIRVCSRYDAGLSGVQEAEIWNWVDLERHPFIEELGGGVASVRDWYKSANMVEYALAAPDMLIDAYGGPPAQEDDEIPPNVSCRGWLETADIVPYYRVVFASALTAIETMASGRWVLAGTAHSYGGWIQDGRIVRVHRLHQMAPWLFSFRGRAGQHDVHPPTGDQIKAEVDWALGEDNLQERRRLREYVESHHERMAQTAKIREVYQEVMAG